MKTEFEKLAEELDALTKAMPKAMPTATNGQTMGDKQGDDEDGDDDLDQYLPQPKNPEGDPEDDPDEDPEDENLPMGKSFRVLDASGREQRGFDATLLLKALDERLNQTATQVEADRTHLGKSMGLMLNLLKAQASQIGALQKSVTKLGNQGNGRKSVLSVMQRPTLAKSVQPDGMNAEDFLTKAMTAMEQGRISSRDIAVAENSLNRGVPIAQELVRRVMGA